MSKRILNVLIKIYINFGFYKFPLIVKIKNKFKNYVDSNNLEIVKNKNAEERKKKLMQIKLSTLKDEIFLKGFENKFKNESCVIIGNGLSLKYVDFSKINVPTFASNSFIMKNEETGFLPTFYTVEGKQFISDNLNLIKKYDVKTKFISNLYKEIFSNNSSFYFYNLDLKHNNGKNINFSKNASDTIFAGQTATYINMQLAFYMGFKIVYLVGMDLPYFNPKTILASGKTLTSQKDLEILSKQELAELKDSIDEAIKNKKYIDHQKDKEKIDYKYAKKIYENSNRKIVNLTRGRTLRVFERQKFEKVFGK